MADREGNIWFTANFKGYIGKLNPKNGEVTEYRMPDPRARDPHTPVFDRDGILWFTVQESNFVGRLDPRTGHARQQRAHDFGRIIPHERERRHAEPQRLAGARQARAPPQPPPGVESWP